MKDAIARDKKSDAQLDGNDTVSLLSSGNHGGRVTDSLGRHPLHDGVLPRLGPRSRSGSKEADSLQTKHLPTPGEQRQNCVGF